MPKLGREDQFGKEKYRKSLWQGGVCAHGLVLQSDKPNWRGFNAMGTLSELWKQLTPTMTVIKALGKAVDW